MNDSSATLPRRGFLIRLAAAVTGGAWLAGSGARRADAVVDDVPFIGEVRMFAGVNPPNGWLFCLGQILLIQDYGLLYPVIGTLYGGDGVTTFGLPDLRGRVAVHPVNEDFPGEQAGYEQVQLTAGEIPAHAHAMAASSVAGTSDDPSGRVPARNAAGVPAYGPAANVNLAPAALLSAGGSSPHQNMQPWLGINFMIATFGDPPDPGIAR